MPGQNRTPLIGWHSADPTLKPWVESEASRRGITRRELLDEMAAEFRKKHDPDKGERAMSTATPELLADLFTDWAKRDGILARITEEQCADLARAFGAGFMIAQELAKYDPDLKENGR